jgi:hypothetical protein
VARHLKSVAVVNWKRAVDVGFELHSHAVELVGPNESGKSSTLDAIVAALAGARHVDPKPLTTGTESGWVTLDLGDLIIERSLTEKSAPTGGTLKVHVKGGGRKVGQRELDALWGDFSFDPLAFSRMRPADQVGALQDLAGQAFVNELSRIDEVIEAAKISRRDAKRDLDRAGTVPNEPEPAVIDSAQALAELEALQARNAEQDKADRARAQALLAVDQEEAKVRACQDRVDELRARLKVAEGELAAAFDRRNQLHVAALTLPTGEPRKPTAALAARVAEAGATQEAHAHWQAAQKRLKALTELVALVAKLEGEVKALEGQRAEHAKTLGAKLPVPGIAWTKAGVTVGGLPWDQLSSGERLVLSTRIGMATHPELRLMLIRDGSLLDETHFAALSKLAEEEDFDLLLETVGRPHEGEHQVIEIREGRTTDRLAAPAVPPEVQAHIDADREPVADRVVDPWSEDESLDTAYPDENSEPGQNPGAQR